MVVKLDPLNGSNANGVFRLVAEGSDPNEKIDIITLENPMVQTGIIFDDGGDYTNSQDGLFVYLYGLDHDPLQAGELEIDHGGATGIIRYEVQNVESQMLCTGTRKRWQCLQNKFNLNRW